MSTTKTNERGETVVTAGERYATIEVRPAYKYSGYTAPSIIVGYRCRWVVYSAKGHKAYGRTFATKVEADTFAAEKTSTIARVLSKAAA